MRNLQMRTFVAAAVIGAVSIVGLGEPVRAQQAQAQAQDQKRTDPKKPQEKKPAQKPKPQRAEPQKPQRPEPQAPPPSRPQPQPQRPSERPPQRQRPQPQAQTRQTSQRLPQPQQQRLIEQQQQRLVQYGVQLDQQQRLAPQQAVQLQQQNRTAQYNVQLQYIAGMRGQQQAIQNTRDYNYSGDPYFYTPASYRYSRGGRYYETNNYGANVLRQAVNAGYEQGFRSGQADRQDRWSYNFRGSYGYIDGNYGYRGFYVDRDEYNYYFRQGFRRGYDDGYYSRHQYGAYRAGNYSVLGNVLTVVLNLRSIR